MLTMCVAARIGPPNREQERAFSTAGASIDSVMESTRTRQLGRGAKEGVGAVWMCLEARQEVSCSSTFLGDEQRSDCPVMIKWPPVVQH